MLDKKTRDALITQAISEIEHAREYKRGRIKQWKANEDLVFGRKPENIPHRSNVMLPKMQGFENTLLSKIRNFPTLKYTKGEESDLKKAKRLTSLLEQTAKPTNGNWKFKDLIGKKSAIRYGWAVFSYWADSVNGYKSHFENVSVYDFLIDPGAGGINIENARNMGRTGIYLSKAQLKQGVKDKIYLSTETNKLVDKEGVASDSSEEEKNKENRYFELTGQKRHKTQTDVYKFWAWYTTYQGERYYLLVNTDNSTAVRCQPLKEIFESNKFPFLSWATDPDLDEFWTPGPDDMVREIFMAQSAVINQMLDNNEMINFPMKAYDVDKVTNKALLNYRRGGLIPFRKDTNISQALQVLETKPINNGITVYEELDKIQQLESGVTAESRGISDEDKVAIYEGNQANIADRLGLLNDSYANMYHRLLELHEYGVKEHLNNKIAIQMIGADGIEWEELSKTDMLPEDTTFDYYISASDAELRNDISEKRAKLNYVTNNRENPIINQKVLAEVEAEIAGFEMDDIKRLFDVDEFGNAELMSECARDIKKLLNGEDIKPNESANVAYKQKMVDYLRVKSEDMKEDQLARFIAYIEDIEPFVIQNTVRKANEVNAAAGNLALEQDLGINPQPDGTVQSQIAPDQLPA
ncbi:MAG TPA: hypothetical protein VF596_16325 [Pyrinomonadaceae bacterium]